MQRLAMAIFTALLVPAFSQSKSNPFVGRWDFTIKTANESGAEWLGVTEKDGNLSVWFQPTGGNVYQVKDFKLNGARLALTLAASGARPAMIWELEAAGG